MSAIHRQIAEVLGWSEQDTAKFSMQSLRELVRPLDPELAAMMDRHIRSQSYVVGEPMKQRGRRGR